MRIYTRTGDQGETSLADGTRLSKGSPLFEVLGNLDELMAGLGFARAFCTLPWVRDILQNSIPRISGIAARLAQAQNLPPESRITEEEIRQLERQIDQAMNSLPKLSGFHFPAGGPADAGLNLVRTVCRRAERALVGYSASDSRDHLQLAYLNRLSDLLFSLALVEEQEAIVQEVKKRVTSITNSKREDNLPKGVVRDEPLLTLERAQAHTRAARKKASAIGVPMVVAVTDEAGDLLLLEKMDGALPVSVELAAKKAYTATVLRMETSRLGEVSQPGSPLYGIQHTDSRLVVFGGGAPIREGDRVIGAIGVSGGSVEQDIACMQAGLAAGSSGSGEPLGPAGTDAK
jgi:cob(I)alamin adenosyltransferase